MVGGCGTWTVAGHLLIANGHATITFTRTGLYFLLNWTGNDWLAFMVIKWNEDPDIGGDHQNY